MEEFQSVIKTDGGDLHSRWSELLEEPNSKGWSTVVWLVKHKSSLSFLLYFLVLLLLLVVYIYTCVCWKRMKSRFGCISFCNTHANCAAYFIHCSRVHRRCSFLTAAVCWHKWSSLLFIFDFSWCWNHEQCFSESVCWSDQLCRFNIYCSIHSVIRDALKIDKFKDFKINFGLWVRSLTRG